MNNYIKLSKEIALEIKEGNHSPEKIAFLKKCVETTKEIIRKSKRRK